MAQVVANDRQQQVANLLKKELRHVDASKLTKLSAIIDTSQGWERLLEELTREGSQQKLRLSLDSINLIKQQVKCGKSPTLALLNHWSITGRKRPTIKILLDYLSICQLRWAEEYILESVLGIKPKPELQISIHQEHKDQVREITFQISDDYKFESLKEISETKELPRYSFKFIYESTSSFSNRFQIGEGRFSTVYKASIESKQDVAAKLLKSNCNEKYLTNEINLMAQVKHDNILELLGVSLGKSNQECHSGYICLVYPFMQNGSLLDCLTVGLPASGGQYLSASQRLSIAIKVARGIQYLHSFESGPIVHRDIKTANIFIDLNLEPKVGDFTLVRQLDGLSHDTATHFSQNITGTSVYMPPEAFRGDISIKFDTFSYGIVLLELLTGLKPFNEELDEDLFTYINEKLSDLDDEYNEAQRAYDSGISTVMPSSVQDSRDKFLSDNLDKKAGNWEFAIAQELFRLALQATQSRKKSRPKVADLLGQLERLSV